MTDYKLVPGTPAAWRASDDFPDSLPNTWSRGVVAVTDFGRVCILSCMGTYWQRPADFAEGEEVVAWADFPDLERATDALDVQGEPDVEKLIRLSDYEALQAECENLRKHLQNLIDQTTPLEPVPGNPMWSRRIQLDEVIAERDQLRAECEKLRNLLVEIERGCSRRDMPSEQTISSWADAIEAAMQRDKP